MRKISVIITALAGIVLLSYANKERRFIPYHFKDNGPGPGDTTKKDTTKYTVFKNLPLKAARKISYTQKEGSWMSLDISPDGQTIAFDLMGDLYTMPVTGGKPPLLQQEWLTMCIHVIVLMGKNSFYLRPEWR
ncbi:MAG: hypothetical protein WDO19_12550 [Bacteroidota bacterium]